MTIRVRLLVWECKSGYWGDTYTAITPFGKYEVFTVKDGSFRADFVLTNHEYKKVGKAQTLDEAKAICQEQWEQLILSCLES